MDLETSSLLLRLNLTSSSTKWLAVPLYSSHILEQWDALDLFFVGATGKDQLVVTELNFHLIPRDQYIHNGRQLIMN